MNKSKNYKRKIQIIIPFFLGLLFVSLSAFVSTIGIKKDFVKNLLPIDTSGFLSNKSQCVMEITQGAMQGTQHSDDSTNYMIFSDFYDCNKTYEIIFLYKNISLRVKMGYSDSLFDSINENDLRKYVSVDANSKNNLLNNFNCFAFIYPQRNPEGQEDVDAMNIDFPITIKAYKRKDKDTWQYQGSKRVATFEEFSEFRFKIIYGLK